MTLLELYHISEMARTRGDAAWKVLDWAAGQQGDFSIRDAYRVYTAAGGESTEQQFATIFNKWVAKYDPRSSKERYRDRDRYGLSQSRPLIITRSGRRGKGGQATYQWGLDGPLRQPPPDDGTPEVEEDDVGEALDKLEGYMGGIELKRRMARWKTLPDMNSVMRDVTQLPARMHAAAMLVASQHLVSSGRVDPGEVEDMEARLDAKAGVPEPTGTPFSPGKPRANLPQDGRPGFRARPPTPPPPTPEAGPEDDDDDPTAEWEDDGADKTNPDAASPFADADAGEPTDDPGAEEGEPETPEGTELRAMLRYGENLSRGKITWRRGGAVVTDEAGHRIPTDSGVELQPLGDEQFDPEYEAMMLWLEEAWPKLLNPPSEGGPDLEAEAGGDAAEPTSDDDGDDGPNDEAPAEGDVIDTPGYPDFLPPANSAGSPGEQAMYRLVDLAQNGGAEIGPTDTLWDLMEANDDEASAAHQIRALFSSPGYPRRFLNDALAVAREVISGQGESEGGGAGDDFPQWAPPAVQGGTPAEEAMYRLVNDYGVNADDAIWDAVTHASDASDVRRIVMANWKGKPKQGFRDAVAVASFGLDNAFEVPEEYEADDDVEPEESEEEPTDGSGGEEQETPTTPVNRPASATPDWLPQPNEDGSRAEAAMHDILSDLPKASGFEDFDASSPIFEEIRTAATIEDAYSIVLRYSVPRIMVKKFLTVARAIFDHDGRDPDTGERVRESVRRRLITMMEDAVDDACEEDPVPDPSKRGPAGVGRLLPMYGMDEGPNLEPVDFAPKSGLARIMRVTGRS